MPDVSLAEFQDWYERRWDENFLNNIVSRVETGPDPLDSARCAGQRSPSERLQHLVSAEQLSAATLLSLLENLASGPSNQFVTMSEEFRSILRRNSSHASAFTQWRDAVDLLDGTQPNASGLHILLQRFGMSVVDALIDADLELPSAVEQDPRVPDGYLRARLGTMESPRLVADRIGGWTGAEDMSEALAGVFEGRADSLERMRCLPSADWQAQIDGWTADRGFRAVPALLAEPALWPQLARAAGSRSREKMSDAVAVSPRFAAWWALHESHEAIRNLDLDAAASAAAEADEIMRDLPGDALGYLAKHSRAIVLAAQGHTDLALRIAEEAASGGQGHLAICAREAVKALEMYVGDVRGVISPYVWLGVPEDSEEWHVRLAEFSDAHPDLLEVLINAALELAVGLARGEPRMRLCPVIPAPGSGSIPWRLPALFRPLAEYLPQLDQEAAEDLRALAAVHLRFVSARLDDKKTDGETA